jgi:hypothetical protein
LLGEEAIGVKGRKMKRVQRAFSSSIAKAISEDVSFAFASFILRITFLPLCGD